MTTRDKPARERTQSGGVDRRRFAHIVSAGVAFQGGSAAVDSSTIMAALVHQLTGSAIAVGAVTTILRLGWLFPQLIVGFLAERSPSSMRYYVIGGFGRAACLAGLALALFRAPDPTTGVLPIVVLLLWTAYAFVSGIVAVPYNDIVARSVTSSRRSRLLATRFFGGGVLALGVAAMADVFVGHLAFPASYAAIIAMASALMLISATAFVSMGEPERTAMVRDQSTFADYLRQGITTFRSDRRFRLFVFAQWAGGAVLVAMPFYVVQATTVGFDLQSVALLLGAQTAGALVSNFLWGWWGDRLGKGSLLQAIAFGRLIPPVAVLSILSAWNLPSETLLFGFMGLFFVLGALANGLTIAVIGFLMEISPEDRRPSYSGYFNAITAPAFLFPLLGGAVVSVIGLWAVFSISLVAAALQFLCIRQLRLRPNLGTADPDPLD